MIYNVRNTKQIPLEEWGQAFWRLKVGLVTNFYQYDSEKDQWSLIPRGSELYSDLEQEWENQLANAPKTKTILPEST